MGQSAGAHHLECRGHTDERAPIPRQHRPPAPSTRRTIQEFPQHWVARSREPEPDGNVQKREKLVSRSEDDARCLRVRT